MGALRRLLRRILPRGTGHAALADLERELGERRRRRERRSGRGAAIRDGVWLAWEGARVAVRLRAERGRTRITGAGLGAEVRTTVRSLVRSPLLTGTAAAVLAFGVAAPTVMFSLVRAIGADLPVPEPDALVHVGHTNARYAPFVTALPGEAVRILRETSLSAGPAAAYATEFLSLAGPGHPERVIAGRVTPDFFEVLRTPPLQGRGFTPGDARPGAQPVVMVGERLWRERFGADPELPGATVRLEGVPHTVVGVVPSPLRLPSGADIWLPVTPGAADDDTSAFHGIARLPPGPARQGALRELQSATARALEAAEAGDDPRPVIRPYRDQMIDADARVILAAMLALAGLVLLIACANVANLLLSRAIARRRELAVRVALGASRWRVAGHQLLESAGVALPGGVAGVLLAVAGVAVARRALAGELAWWMELRLDTGVLLFAAATVALAALLAGLLPAVHAVRSDPDAELRGGGRRGNGPRLSRLSRALVVAEVGFSAAVLVVSGLMVRGALSYTVDDRTVDPESVLVTAYTLPEDRPPEPRQRLDFHRTLVERLSAHPGVQAVALTGVLPGVPGPTWPIEVPAFETADPEVVLRTHVIRVSPGYFEALGAPLVRGRGLTWRDGDGDPPAAVVNESFVEQYFPDGDPLGRRVRVLPPAVDEPIDAVVVGVAPPLGIVDRSRGRGDALYLPPAASIARGAYVVARAGPGLDAGSLLPGVRNVVGALDPDLPLYDVATLAEHQRGEWITEWFFAGLFTTFGLAGLVMAGAGLYAVIAFAVGRRRREVGVRVALGAGPGRVVWTVARPAAVQLAAGLVLGLGLAALGTPAFGEALLGADPRDPAVYALIALLTGLTGLLAATVPAVRALAVRPAEALRAE